MPMQRRRCMLRVAQPQWRRKRKRMPAEEDGKGASGLLSSCSSGSKAQLRTGHACLAILGRLVVGRALHGSKAGGGQASSAGR